MEKNYVSKERPFTFVNFLRAFTLALLFCVLNFNSFSQAQKTSSVEKFVFVGLTDPDKESFYRQSIDAANMESYRLKSKRVTLHFENGFEIEMLSAKELYMKDNSIIVSSYLEGFPKNYFLPTFKILPDGHLMAMYPKTGKP